MDCRPQSVWQLVLVVEVVLREVVLYDCEQHELPCRVAAAVVVHHQEQHCCHPTTEDLVE